MWITGLPASGKSTLAAQLAGQLGALGIQVTVLESDALLFTAKQGRDKPVKFREYKPHTSHQNPLM